MQSDTENELQQSNLVRMNLNVTDGVPEKLRDMAGGRFKMGAWLSRLIEEMHKGYGQPDQVKAMELEGVRLMMLGLGGQVQSLRGEVAHLQAQLAALIAKSESV